jgi:hypothetical protein
MTCKDEETEEEDVAPMMRYAAIIAPNALHKIALKDSFKTNIACSRNGAFPCTLAHGIGVAAHATIGEPQAARPRKMAAFCLAGSGADLQSSEGIGSAASMVQVAVPS